MAPHENRSRNKADDRRGDRSEDFSRNSGTQPASLATAKEIAAMRRMLHSWYQANRRDLPWRRTRDPYAIWVSEIMLQQTRVAAVEERYRLFLEAFPTIATLAAAAEAEVLALWSGLGYYRRARMLHKAAKMVVDPSGEFGGAMPASAESLRALPGIGAYTSAAIASIAYGEPVAVVDGNVERVVQRLAGWGSDTASPAELARSMAELAQRLLDPPAAGDFNQAMMELGATVCLPRTPHCLTCPIRTWCQTRGEHLVTPRAPMRSQEAAYALILRTAGSFREVLLHQRAASETVMPGMWELPQLREKRLAGVDIPEPGLPEPKLPKLELPKLKPRLTVRHAIMQVNYRVGIHAVQEEDAQIMALPAKNRRWVRLYDLSALPLTGLARKVLLRSKLAELAEAQ